MSPERALEIVAAINDRAFFTMGLVDKVRSLQGVTLAEMIEAKAVVAAGNEERREIRDREGGSVSINVLPDDRLIAAAYALEHYYPDDDAVAVIPTSEWPYNRRALGIVGLEPDAAEKQA